MNQNKQNLKNIIKKTIEENLQSNEDKLLAKKDIEIWKQDKENRVNPKKDKSSKKNELIKTAVTGFVQAFDAMNKAMNELDENDYMKFSMVVMKHLEDSGISVTTLQHFKNKLSAMSRKT